MHHQVAPLMTCLAHNLWRNRRKIILASVIFTGILLILRLQKNNQTPDGARSPLLGKQGYGARQPLHPSGWFPGEESGAFIPHIIHQTWDSTYIPRLFLPWIKSWVLKHPRWQYWLWTPRDVGLLLATHYPQYVDMYNNYTSMQDKANVMRYFIMYHYGGVYADVDLESLHAMDKWTYKYHCIIPEENFEHSILLNHRSRGNAMLTLLACRPHHPYFKMALEMLHTYGNMTRPDQILFVDTVYQKYVETDNNKHGPEEDGIFLAPPKYFLPTFDERWTAQLQSICSSISLGEQQKKICVELKSRHYHNIPGPEAFTDHHWTHVMHKEKYWKFTSTVHISQIVPKRYNITHAVFSIPRSDDFTHKNIPYGRI